MTIWFNARAPLPAPRLVASTVFASIPVRKDLVQTLWNVEKVGEKRLLSPYKMRPYRRTILVIACRALSPKPLGFSVSPLLDSLWKKNLLR